MFHIIYKVTNNINNYIYIGAHSTDNLDDGYMGSGKALNRAFSYFGKQNFSREIIFIFETLDEMFQKEAELVDPVFVRRIDTYNKTTGGKRGLAFYGSEFSNNKGNHRRVGNWGWKKRPVLTETLKVKISEGLKRVWKERGGSFTGKTHSADTKTIISTKAKIHQSGSGNSQYGTMWITDGFKNLKIKIDDLIPDGWNKGRTLKRT